MRIFLLLVLLALSRCPISAQTQSGTINLPRYIEDLVVPAVPAPEIQKSYSMPVDLEYAHSWLAECSDGGMPFEYNGRKYYVRLGFDRGKYDPYIKNYKSIPGVIFSEVSSDDVIGLWDFYSLQQMRSQEVCYQLRDNSTICMKFDGISLSFAKNGVDLVLFKYTDLIAAWSRNANQYSKHHGSAVQYFVPQAYYKNASYYHGYVLSEVYPLYPNSGLPLDFVELYRKKDSSYDIRPMAYSVPLGLSFKYLGGEGKSWTWTIKDLTEEDLADAVADEID